MVIRDSRGKVNVNNSWKSQITTRAYSVRAISVSVDKLTSQVETGRGKGRLISSQPRRNSHKVQAYSWIKSLNVDSCWPAPQTKLKLWLTPSAKHHRNPCFEPPPVYQDLVRVMIGLLKRPLSICQSGWKEIRNALPVIRWVRWVPRTRYLCCFADVTMVTECIEEEIILFAKYKKSRLFL